MISLELVAVVITVAAVSLTARQVIWCWPLNMLSTTLYAMIFFQARLYAGMGLQGLYFALAIYGWWAWLYGGEHRSKLQVTVASGRLRLFLAALATIAGIALGMTLNAFTDASLPFLDSMLTTFSIAAQWMQTRKLLDNWVLWIAVDICYIGLFVYRELYPTAGLYAAFLILASMGFVHWRRSMRESTPDAMVTA